MTQKSPPLVTIWNKSKWMPTLDRVHMSPMNCIKNFFFFFKYKSPEAVVIKYLFWCPLSIDETMQIDLCPVCLVGRRFCLFPEDLLIQGSIQEGLCFLSEPVSKWKAWGHLTTGHVDQNSWLRRVKQSQIPGKDAVSPSEKAWLEVTEYKEHNLWSLLSFFTHFSDPWNSSSRTRDSGW